MSESRCVRTNNRKAGFDAMEYSYALERLANHANMPGLTLGERESFLCLLWQAERGNHPPILRPLFEDILDCLAAANHTLNGEIPSEVVGRREWVARRLVACMSIILSDGWGYFCKWNSTDRFDDSFRAELAGVLLKIGIAWGAILAGDIDDIREHTEREFAARNVEA